MALTDWSAMSKAEKPRGAWYLADSLVALGEEINRRWPHRDTSSDGAVGDTSHQARKSDHNPDWDDDGQIRAIDIDVNGIDVAELLEETLKEPRLAYIIYNRRIASATQDGTPWNWEPYDGDNPHTGHVHFSIKHTRSAETNTSRWLGGGAPTTPEDDPFMGLSAADISAAVAAGVKAAVPSLAAADLQGELTAVRADNAFDSQAASYHAVANALASFRISEAAAANQINPARLESIRLEALAVLRPLFEKKP